jgi:hypothetical protein
MHTECGRLVSRITLRIPIVTIKSLSWTIVRTVSILSGQLEVAVHTASCIPSTSMGQSATWFCMA